MFSRLYECGGAAMEPVVGYADNVAVCHRTAGMASSPPRYCPACQIVTHGQDQDVPHPRHSGADKDPGQPATVAHVHEEEDDQESFDYSNSQRYRHTEGMTKVQVGEPPGQEHQS